jgi:outer membrane protein
MLQLASSFKLDASYSNKINIFLKNTPQYLIQITMKKIVFFFAFFIIQNIKAQTIELSLNKAFELALQNRTDLKAQQLDVSIAQNAIKKAQNEWLPTVSAAGNVRYNTQLQTTVLPAGFGGSSSEQMLAFGTKNNTSLSIDLTQNVYNPAIKTNIDVQKNNLMVAQTRQTQQQSSVKVQVAEAYLNVILKELQLKMADNDAKRQNQYTEVAAGQFKLGTLIESDYLTAQLNQANAKMSVQTAKQNYEQAMTTLRFQLNIDPNIQLVLTDNLTTIKAEDADKLIQKSVFIDRSDVTLLELENKSNALYLKKAQQNALPTVSVYGNYSSQFQSNNFDYAANNNWSNFNYIGLKLNVPISAHFTNKPQKEEYRLKTQQTSYELIQKKNSLQNELTQAQTNLNNTLLNVNSTKANQDLAQTIYNQLQNQFKLGTVTYNRILDTDKSLATAENNFITAVYSYLVAKLNYERAAGKLN